MPGMLRIRDHITNDTWMCFQFVVNVWPFEEVSFIIPIGSYLFHIRSERSLDGIVDWK